MTSGPTGCSRSSSAVTTPKLPPPPRSAQNSSGCSSAMARTGSPSAVTSSTASRLSHGQAVLALEPARAAAEREAGDAGARHAPADGGEAVLLGGARRPRPRSGRRRRGRPAAPGRRSARAGRGRRSRGRRRRATAPATEWPAGAHRDRAVARSRANASAALTWSSGAEHARDVARARLDHRVEERAGVLVLGLAGVVDMASQGVAQLVQGGVMDDRHIHPRRPPRTGYS